MKNAIVYSFHVREKNLTHNLCYKELLYSIDTLRKYNRDIQVYIYISPSNLDTSILKLDKNTHLIKFDNIIDDGWPESWVQKQYIDLLKHRWENAIKSVVNFKLDNILYLDTDTVFYNNPNLLFDKYGNTNNVWAKQDNSDFIMKKIQVYPGMNDGQFILSKNVANLEILDHIKFYVGHVLEKNKHILTEAEYLDLHWVSVQYAVFDYFKNKGNGGKGLPKISLE